MFSVGIKVVKSTIVFQTFVWFGLATRFARACGEFLKNFKCLYSTDLQSIGSSNKINNNGVISLHNREQGRMA